MSIRILDKKYAPYLLLAGGVIVFSAAFFYASGKDISPREENSDEGQGLSVAGGQDNILNITKEISETPEASISQSPTPKPTKAATTPTAIPTIPLSPTPTVTPTPEATQAVSSSTPSPSPAPTLSETPTSPPSPTP